MPNSPTDYRFLTSAPGAAAAPGGEGKTSNGVSPYSGAHDSELQNGSLSIALIGPEDRRREAMALALREYPSVLVREFASYPASRDELPALLEQYDALIIDLDSNLEYALELVESLSVKGSATVMVYSDEASPDKLVRSMRAGAREFLAVPVEHNAIKGALLRATSRRPAGSNPRRATGKLLTFMGAKGGVGVTTLACNFALALAYQRSQSTLLIDLADPLGDVALNLGIQSEYSTVNALQAADRLDSSFLSKLLVKHSYGLAVLPAPGKFLSYQFANDAISKLLSVARQSFDYVVVDAGSRLDLTEMSLFKDASVIYLIAQVGVAELRNSNRLISQFFTAPTPQVEIVLNRHDPRSTLVPDDYIAKVLTRSPQWKIPNDYPSVQRTQIDATPLLPGDSPIAQVIQEMARAITGEPVPEKKKKKKVLGLFR
jgi:pilus assembly protein CpaE